MVGDGSDGIPRDDVDQFDANVSECRDGTASKRRIAAASCTDMVGVPGLAARGVGGRTVSFERVPLPRRQALNARTRILSGPGFVVRERGVDDPELDCCCCFGLGLDSADSTSSRGIVPDGGEKSMSVCTESQ